MPSFCPLPAGRNLTSLLLSFATAGVLAAGGASAQDGLGAPKGVVKAIENAEVAANRRDLDGALEIYSKDFSRADGLDVSGLARGLEELWARYPRLVYDIELVAWNETDGGFEYETVTRIEGSGDRAGQTLRLEALLRSRQRLEKGRIVSQEILMEQTQLFLGQQPPLVQVNLPEVVSVKQPYSFDVIALDPLEEEVLLGAASEEPANGLNYLGERALDLEVLSAGGLYQVGTAPDGPSDRWLSAVVARPGGVTFIGRRLRVIP